MERRTSCQPVETLPAGRAQLSNNALEERASTNLRWLMDINLWGVVYATKIFLPHLEKEKSAHIINFISGGRLKND